MSSAKKLTMLNSGLLPGQKSRDNFRSKIGSWSVHKDNPVYQKRDTNIQLKLVKTEIDKENILGDFYNTTETYEVGYPMAEDDVLSEIPSAIEETLDFAKFSKILKSIELNKKFEDFATVVRIPVSKKLKRASSDEDLPATIRFEYNYLDKAYERLLQRPVTDVVEIPSMYSMVSEANTNTVEENSLQAPTINQLRKNTIQSASRRKFQNQYVVGSPASTIGVHEDNKFLFPMWTEINVPVGRVKRIATDFQETDLGACIMRDIFESSGEQTSVSEDTTLFMEIPNGNTRKVTMESQTVNLNDYYLYDIAAWSTPRPLENDSMFISAPGSNTDQQQNVWTGGENITTQEALANNDGDFSLTIPLGIGVESLRGKMDLILEEHARSFKKISNGETAHSEMLMYVITKKSGDIEQNSGAPLQSFVFFNSSDAPEDVSAGIVSFIDTQVKYDREYTYIVEAYRAVVGNQYYYKTVKLSGLTQKNGKIWTKIKVVNLPTIKLFQIPVFYDTGRVVAPAPYYPQFNVEHIKGNTKGLLFSFDTQVGETYEEPITFSEYEESIASQFLSDNKRSRNGEVLYKTVEAISGVQVFRTDVPPEDYYSFKGNLLRTISTDADLASNLSAGSVAKIILQSPNKKFYYMFRSQGFHGETSNPSPVYEIELYNDGGVAYPIVRPYELKDKNYKTFTRPMKNLIRIAPRTTQAMINEKASGLIDENGRKQNAIGTKIILGNENESLFGKTFKIRLTSKDTGKKIDINVSFRTKVVKAPIPTPVVTAAPPSPERYDPMELDLPTPDDPFGGFQILDQLGPTMEDEDEGMITPGGGGGGSGY
jgi:hypothetical protein